MLGPTSTDVGTVRQSRIARFFHIRRGDLVRRFFAAIMLDDVDGVPDRRIDAERWLMVGRALLLVTLLAGALAFSSIGGAASSTAHASSLNQLTPGDHEY